MDDFRKPRADIPILPQTAFYRKRVVYKPPKHRRGKKPKRKREKKVRWYDAPRFKDIKERDEKRKEVELKISKQKQEIAKEVREEGREQRRVEQETERLDIQREQLRADTEAQGETQRYRAQHQLRLTQQEERQLALEDRRDAERRDTMERLAQISAEGERRSGQNQLMMGTLILKMRDRGNPIREEDIEPTTREERERPRPAPLRFSPREAGQTPRPARTPRQEERFGELAEKAVQTEQQVAQGRRVARSYADVATELEQRELVGEKPTPRSTELPLYQTGFDVPPTPRGIEEAEEQVEAGLEQGLRVGQAKVLRERTEEISKAIGAGGAFGEAGGGSVRVRQGVKSPGVRAERQGIISPKAPTTLYEYGREQDLPPRTTEQELEEERTRQIDPHQPSPEEVRGFAGYERKRERRKAVPVVRQAEPETEAQQFFKAKIKTPQPEPQPEPVAEPEPVSHYQALMALKQEGVKTTLYKDRENFDIPDEKGFVIQDKTGFTKKANKGKYFEVLDLPADESKNIGIRDLEKAVKAGDTSVGHGSLLYTKFERGIKEGKLELHITQDIREGLFEEEEEEEEEIV